MTKIVKEVLEHEFQVEDTKPGVPVNLLVKTISVTYGRKMNPANYAPKYAYESVDQSVTAWADLIDPVPVDEIEACFTQLEERVKAQVNNGLGDVVRQMVEKGKVATLDLNAVYTAFLDGQIDDPDKDTISARWSAFLAAAGLKTKEDFR